MKKRSSFLIILLLSVQIFCGISLAEETSLGALPLKNMPENPLGVCPVSGLKTNGVTFVVDKVHYDHDAHTLEINVLQLPNDDYTAVMDNQVENPNDTSQLDSEMAQLSLHGYTALGTVCDILTITDAKGHSLFQEYKITESRPALPSLNTHFTIFLPADEIPTEINVELALGVNEDLRHRFPSEGSLHIKYSLPGENGEKAALIIT